MKLRPRRGQRGFLVNPFAFGGGGSAPSTPSPTWANVSLLIHGDSRPFLDVSGNRNVVENHLGTFSVSSGEMLLSSGPSSDGCLRIPASGVFDFGTGAWAMVAKVTCGSAGARIFDTRTNATGATNGVAMTVQATTLYPFVSIGGVVYGVGGAGLPAGNLRPVASVRSELAFSYDGTTLRCFVDGSLSWSHVVALSPTAGSNLIIGNTQELFNVIAGVKLAELMIVKGEAVYTAAYTPATRQGDSGITLEAGDVVAPFSNVKLLLHGAGANGSTTFTDSSSFARAASRFGNAQISTAQARFGTSSMLFDGSGDYLTYANSADFNFGTGDFCVEAQVRLAVTTGQQVIASNYQGSTAGWGVDYYTDRLRFGYGDPVQVQSQTSVLPATTWKHVAIGRIGTRLMLFIEGELFNMVLNHSTNLTSTAALGIGRLVSFTGSDFNGHMQELRITKAQCPYVRSFAVQAAAHPNA